MLMEWTGCNAMEIRYQMPVDMRKEYLSHKNVLDKAMPEIIKRAKNEAGLSDKDGKEDFDEDDE